MTRTADLIVVGLGAVGSAALYQAARRGLQTIGIDQFTPPHDRGSSHGDTRITRRAIGEGSEFVPLVLRSDEIWDELQSATGRDLVTRCGCLVLQSPTMASNHHGAVSFIGTTLAAARHFGIEHEQLSAAEIRSRFPQFIVRDDEAGYFEPGAGFLRPETCIEAQLSEARRLGAEILTEEAVLEVTGDAGRASILTTKNSYTGENAIVTAGPWTAKLLTGRAANLTGKTPFGGENLPSAPVRGKAGFSGGNAILTTKSSYSSENSAPAPAFAGFAPADLFRVYRQILCWFAIAEHPEQFTPGRFPVFIWITGERPRDMLYGFPAIDDISGGMKVATEQYDCTTDADGVDRQVDHREIAAMHAEYIAPRLPWVSSQCLRYKTCLYTVTPDAKFVVDQFERCEHIWFASACSGHGFKHSAALGEALVQAAVSEPLRVNLEPFRANRFAGDYGPTP